MAGKSDVKTERAAEAVMDVLADEFDLIDLPPAFIEALSERIFDAIAKAVGHR